MVGVSACYHPDSTVSHGLRGGEEEEGMVVQNDSSSVIASTDFKETRASSKNYNQEIDTVFIHSSLLLPIRFTSFSSCDLIPRVELIIFKLIFPSFSFY